jgi:uncharacterized glyoxalase superfamily protein PhnB
MGYEGSTVIPSLRYRDAPAAVTWLAEAFGFEERLVVPTEDGRIAHAQMTYGTGMVMFGSIWDDDMNVTTPQALSGASTHGIYVIVEDPDAHHARAVAAGAEIVRELRDEDYGSRGYSARDPEGHLWHFGTYEPA